MGEGSGFGKTILFGEHFVVYGLPAIASAIETKTVAKVERIQGSDYAMQDDRPEIPGYKKKKFDQQVDATKRVFAAMGIDTKKTPVKVTLAGDLVAASGTGASAASCTAIARAASQEFGLGYGNERINEIAYEGEKGYHGTPSGIDNTVSTYGGLIWFKKGTPPLMESLKIGKPVEVVIASTGITANTTEVVESVKKQKEAEPKRYEEIFKRYTDLVIRARKAVEEGDWAKVGKLMNENQELLREINVSGEKNELLVKLALENGALGAKVTGTGRGGNVVALTPGKALQEKVAKAIEAKGFMVVRTRIGVKPK